jgi:hypothetical protein
MDDEKERAVEWMRDFAKKMVHGLKLVTVNNVRYRDKYIGAEAWIAFYGDGNYTVTTTDNGIFVEAFPVQNHKHSAEIPGWLGSVEEWRKIVRSSDFRRVWLKHVLSGDWDVYRVER